MILFDRFYNSPSKLHLHSTALVHQTQQGAISAPLTAFSGVHLI